MKNGNAEGVTRGDKYFYDHVGVKKVLVILGKMFNPMKVT